jgi:hypothetical protein
VSVVAPDSQAREEERDVLFERVRQVLRRGPSGQLSSESFLVVARAIFDYQRRYCPVSRAFWDTCGVNPSLMHALRHIPPIPTALFKHARIATFPESQTVATFVSSGTTGSFRSRHQLDTLELYRQASVPVFAHYLMPGGDCPHLLALLPAPSVAPNSSLSAMVGFVAESGLVRSTTWCAEPDRVLVARFVDAARSFERLGEPVLVVGTAFAFVQLADALSAAGAQIRLPPGSRAMETGGFKGRSRELERAELVTLVTSALGLEPGRVVNEYGMSELSSQLYTLELQGPQGSAPGRWRGPPWLRVRAVDPVTGLDVPAGEIGVLALYDLANVSGGLAVLTSDLGRVFASGDVEVLGRAPGIAPRGCSLAFDTDGPPASPATDDAQRARLRPAVAQPELHDPLSLEQLRVAARSLRANGSAAGRAKALSAVFSAWRRDLESGAADGELDLVAAEAGLSLSVLRAGTLAALEAVSLRELRKWLRKELTKGATAAESVLLVGAGNLPFSVVSDCLAPLLLGCVVLVRPSARATEMLRLFLARLRAEAPELAALVVVAEPRGPREELPRVWLEGADAVIFSGSDEAAQAALEGLPPTTPRLVWGSRTSLGVVCAESATRDGTVLAAARDVWMWDQRGCLSPCAFVVEGHKNALRFAQGLEMALGAARKEWPRGRLPLELEVKLHDEVWAQWAKSVDDEYRRWGPHVWLARSNDTPPALAGRRVAVLPTPDLLTLPQGLEPLRGKVSTVGHAVDPTRGPEWTRAYLRLGATRFCALGDMQRPPAAWHHDGVSAMRFLVRQVSWA